MNKKIWPIFKSRWSKGFLLYIPKKNTRAFYSISMVPQDMK